MSIRTRIAKIERLRPRANRAQVSSPLSRIIEAVNAAGGRLASESWAEATARLAGITVSELRADLQRRAAA